MQGQTEQPQLLAVKMIQRVGGKGCPFRKSLRFVQRVARANDGGSAYVHGKKECREDGGEI